MPANLNNTDDIIKLLQQMELHYQEHAAPLPLEEDVKTRWAGIGFRIGEHYFVVALDYVREIIKYPKLSFVPGGKDWVKGIANIRGNLLPVFDLNGFLNKTYTPLKRETRVLAIVKGELSAGLIVDEVYGMKYFDRDSYEEQLRYNVAWQNYFDGGYQSDDKKWIVFDIGRLVDDADFLHVAA